MFRLPFRRDQAPSADDSTKHVEVMKLSKSLRCNVAVDESVESTHGVSSLQAISDMLTVAGASATVLEARVPYATDATQELLGQKVPSFCSQECAVLLAKKAYQRAAQLSSPGTPILGLSCTAALRTV